MIRALSFTKIACLVSCFSLFIFLLPFLSSAQTSAFVLTVSPKHPGPFEDVLVSVEDYSQDLNRVDIAWTVNGKIEKQGVGEKRLKFRTGAIGTTDNISINIGGEIHSLTVRPTKIDLIWQADTYTPPFYKGKALHSNQDPITVVAEPFFLNSQGVRLDPDQLVYRWKKDDKIIDVASGYGKKSYSFTPSILMKPANITVEVSSVDNSFMSTASVSIPDSRTQAIIYENHPLYGIMFGQALNDREFAITDHEASLIAVPFFFSNRQKQLGALAYDWRLNNSSLNQPGNEIIFRRPEGVSQGRSSVSISVKNLERFMQSAATNVSVVFGEDQTNASSNNPVF